MTKKFKRVFKKMLENAESRVVLFHIMVTAGTFLHGFVPGDSHATSFHTGQRSIGLMIYNWIMETRPDMFLQMQKEYKEFVHMQENANKELQSEGDDFVFTEGK